jgi:MFS family permease
MSRLATQTQNTNWSGVAYGIVLGFVAAYFQFKVPPVLPVLFDSYAYSPFVGGALMSVFALAGLVLSVPVGHAIERHGALPFLGGAFTLMLAGSALGLAAPEDGTTMLLSRGLEGIGAAVLAVCMPAFSNMNAGPRHLSLVIAAQATWIPVGQVLANAIAGPFVADAVWQPVWWGGIAAITAMALWTVAIARGGRVALGPRKRSGDDDAAPAEPLSRREWGALLAATTLFFVWQVQFMAYFTWLPEYLVSVRGAANDAAVLASQLPAVMLLVVAFATGFVLRAGVGAPDLLVFGLALQAAGWLMVPFDTAPAWTIASSVVWGIAAGITPTCLWSLPATLLGGHRTGTVAAGVVLSGRYLGIIVGPILAPFLLAWFGDWDTAIAAFGIATAVTVPWAFYFARMARRLRAAQGTSR